MFGDQPEAADLGRKCEICRVELEIDFPRCQICTEGESNLWERIEQLKIGSGERIAMTILTDWSKQLPEWNLQPGLEMLLKPSNCRFPRTSQSKRAPFVVVEGIDSSGKTTHVEAIANALAHLHYPVRVITFPNNLTPLGRFLKQILQTGSYMECWTQHILFSLHRWELVDMIQESLITGTAVICERYAWSGVVYSYVSKPQMPLEAYMTCDQGILQPDVVILLTTSPQESIGRRNAISPQFEDESIQQKLWDTYHCDCLWEGVTKLDFHPLLRPYESRKVLQRRLMEILETQQQQLGQWKYLWETPGMCKVCHTETNSDQPIQRCTSCYKQVHHVCLHNDDQAISIPVCRACASGPDPDGGGVVPAEAPCPPDGEPRIEVREDIPTDTTPLDSTGVVPCPTHGMDHLTGDPSCEFCKRALGPLYRHLKGKYGTRLDDQTPTLSFDFSGPFPVSATGARFMLLFVWRLADIRLLWAFALDRRTKENVRSCLQDVMAELTQLTGGSKPPVMRVHSDQAGEFLSPVVMEWLKQHNIKQTFTSGYDPAANGVAERWIDLVKIKATVLLAANHLSTAYWNYAVAWVTYAYNNKVLAIPKKKALPEFGQLILVKSKRDHKLQDKGHLAVMMGIYPKISNGIVALMVKDEKLGELCTAHCSITHVEDELKWFLKRDPNNPTRRVYMSNKGEVTWDIPISSLPTVEEKEVWNRHPTFVSLQRSRDGWAWYTANVGRLLPSYQDIEVEDGEDPLPDIGGAGFHSYAQLPQIETDPAHDTIPPIEVPFVPQSMVDDEFQPELLPPPARGPRHVQGEIRLPASVRDEIEQMERDMPPTSHAEVPSSEGQGDIIQAQPVELNSPRRPEEGNLFPQIGGGVHDIPQSDARSSTQPPDHLVSFPEAPFQREFTPDGSEQTPGEPLDDTMDWFQREEPVRQRPPRQLRSRTIGQVKWDSTHGVRMYDAETGAIQDETREPILEEGQRSWYGSKVKRRCSDHIRSLLQDPRPPENEEIHFSMEDELILPSETLMVTGTIQQDTTVPPIISLEGPDVEPSTGSFAVLSQCLINKMDTLERQFQKWYTSLILGLGRHLDQVNASIEAIYQMGLTKREAKREEYQAYRKEKQSTQVIEDTPQDGKPEEGLQLNPWTAWIAQVRLNEQEVPEFFRTSDAMKQTVEIVEDEEVLQTTTCTPKDIDKDPEGWKVAFREELDSFDRLDVMDAVPLNTLDTSTIDILPCKVVMVKKPKGDGTHRKKGRVVVCGNFQQVQPGEETCANTPSFPMLRTLISLAALYRWAVESWDVSTAFLYAPLIEKRDVYCKPPQVLVKLGLVQPGTVWKLKKALYGLRTSPRAWEEERDRKLSTLTWDSPVGKVGLKPVDTTHCVWTIRQLDNSDDTPPMGMVIAYVDDLIAVGDQSQLDCMKSELDKLYVMKTSGSIPAQYQPGLEPLRFLGCLIERMPDGQIIMHQRSYIEHCFRENDMELMKGGVTLPNVDEKGSPEAPVDQYGHPTEFERSKSTCQKYIGQLMWLATRTRPDISPVLGMIASQMVIRPTEMVKCLTQLWRYIKGTSTLSMTSFFPNPSSVFGKLRLNVYVDASFSSGGSRSRSGMAMYLVDTTDGSESIIQWASRRQTSMAASAPEAEVTAMAEGFATAIFLFDSLKEIRVITGFGPDCILSMKTDSAVALKQMNTHTVTVRTRTAAQKLAFLRELIYQDPQIQPIYIPGPSQRADSQTKCLSGPALRKAQEYLNLRHVVTPVVSTIRVLGVDRSDADSSAGEGWKECGKDQEMGREGSRHVRPVRLCQSQEGSLDRIHGQEGMQVSSHRTFCELGQKKGPFLFRLRMDCMNQDQDNVFLQEYRRIVTVIRQEDIGVDVHDKCSPMPFMCGSSHMPRKEEGSAHKKTRPQTPTPRGDVSTADERVKADRETQRRERAQAKQRMLQHVSVPAKASMRGHGTESESSIVRKRPAHSEDETPLVPESGALPAIQTESEMSQSVATTDPQQSLTAEESQPTDADPHQPMSVEESQPSSTDPRPALQADESQPDPSQVERPVEEATPTQTGESSTQGSSTVKRRVSKKGSIAIAAEQGSISDLRSHDTSVPSAGDSELISTPKAEGAPRPGLVPRPPSSPREVTTPKAVPSPIAASPKSPAPKAASPKKAVVKTVSLPKTVSAPKALLPLGGQSPPKAASVPKETVPKKRTPWADLVEEDPTESVPKSNPETRPKSEEPPKTKSKSGEPPKTKPKSEGPPKAKPKSDGPPKAKPWLNPAAATVTVKPPQSKPGKFLVREMGASEWPVDEPRVKLPVWKKKDSFLTVFFDHKVIVAHCPTGSGKSTILPAVAAMHLHPQAGRVCCTQIRRVTTQSVSRNTKDIWNIERESLVVGYQHGTEPQEHWNQHQTKVLFLTEGIVMRQVMSHDEHTHPETILPGCRVLMLDEAHSGSTDIELILARILPRINQVENFRLVQMSATLNIDTFVRRVTDAGVPRSDVGIFHMDERTNPLALYCVPPNLLRERDNMELALRMIIKIHHEYRGGYQNSRGSITGPILVFVPGKAEIRLLIELIKNAVKRGLYLRIVSRMDFMRIHPREIETFSRMVGMIRIHRVMENWSTTIGARRVTTSIHALPVLQLGQRILRACLIGE